MTMTEPTIIPAPSLDAVLATHAGQRVGRMSFLRPRAAQRRGVAPSVVPTEEDVLLSDLLSDETVESDALQVDAPVDAWIDATAEVTHEEPVGVPEAESVEPPVAEPVEVPADVTGPVLQRMRAVHIARERLREADEERLRRHSGLVHAEAELDEALVQMQARLEGLARSARGLESLTGIDGIDDVGDVIALLRTQAG